MEYANLLLLILFLLGQLLINIVIKYRLGEYNAFNGVEFSNKKPTFDRIPDANKENPTFRSYENNNTSGCTVSVVDHLSHQTVQQKENLRCSHKILDEYFRDTHQFHGEGTWYVPTVSAPGRDVQYQPTICTFASILEKQGGLRKCLKMRNITKILITGDSNGRFLKQGIIDVLESTNHTCVVTRSSAMDANGTVRRDRTYFDIPGIDHSWLRLKRTMFIKESSAVVSYICTSNGSSGLTSSLEVEFIHTAHVYDTTVGLSDMSTATGFGKGHFRADSLTEYLLKYYYPYRTFPDIWFNTAPFHNRIMDTSLPVHALDVSKMLRVLEMYLPKTTEIIFIADATSCPNVLIKQLASEFIHFWNVTMNERIHEMNQVLYSKLVPEFSRHQNYHAFLDASRIACPITCKWHNDPGHMLPVWYYKMAEYNLDLICSEL